MARKAAPTPDSTKLGVAADVKPLAAVKVGSLSCLLAGVPKAAGSEGRKDAKPDDRRRVQAAASASSKTSDVAKLGMVEGAKPITALKVGGFSCFCACVPETAVKKGQQEVITADRQGRIVVRPDVVKDIRSKNLATKPALMGLRADVLRLDDQVTCECDDTDVGLTPQAAPTFQAALKEPNGSPEAAASAPASARNVMSSRAISAAPSADFSGPAGVAGDGASAAASGAAQVIAEGLAEDVDADVAQGAAQGAAATLGPDVADTTTETPGETGAAPGSGGEDNSPAARSLGDRSDFHAELASRPDTAAKVLEIFRIHVQRASSPPRRSSPSAMQELSKVLSEDWADPV